MNCSDFYERVKPKGRSISYNTCVKGGIQNYENLIARELCWPLMKLSTDCCIEANSKQWICRMLKNKTKGQRNPLIFAAALAAAVAGAAGLAGVGTAIFTGIFGHGNGIDKVMNLFQ